MGINIYALTDSHQESRNLSHLLSGIYNYEKDNNAPFIILDGGDLFKGIYDKDLSVNAYLKIKELLPQAQIFLTLGNNDFGFKKADFEYLKNTVMKFKNVGIEFVCANIYDSKTDKCADFVPQYKILEIDNKKILITGFCVNNSCAKKFGYTLKPMEEAYQELINSIKEPYDKVIVLSHHWYTYSRDLKEFSKTTKSEIDLIIGGHEHSPIAPDFERKIFYPLSFAKSLYRFYIEDEFENIENINVENFDFIPELENPITEFEESTGLKKPVAKRLLDLTKKYSEPCPMGTFISDYMKKLGNTDIAFHSTGFTMGHLKLEDGPLITRYDIDRVICQDSSPICKLSITVDKLKKVFENATSLRMYKNRGNTKFLQCSQNITITGKGNKTEKSYKIIQININGEDLLDKNQNPKSPERSFSCTLDTYLASGEQGFDILRDIPNELILLDGETISLNKLLYMAIQDAEKNFDGSTIYPCFKLIDLC